MDERGLKRAVVSVAIEEGRCVVVVAASGGVVLVLGADMEALSFGVDCVPAELGSSVGRGSADEYSAEMLAFLSVDCSRDVLKAVTTV